MFVHHHHRAGKKKHIQLNTYIYTYNYICIIIYSYWFSTGMHLNDDNSIYYFSPQPNCYKFQRYCNSLQTSTIYTQQ